MASLKDDFKAYYPPDEDAVSAALHLGLVALDTNVLLSFYRLQPQARDELFRILEQLGDQLWIPYQVALEFHQNRLNVIADQERLFDNAREDLKAAIGDYIQKFRTFSGRVVLPQHAVRKLVQQIDKAHMDIDAEITLAEQGNEVHLDSLNQDEVLTRLETLFDNRVGSPPSTDELIEMKKEAQKRVGAKIPPGYMDRGKSDPAGDYILWKQLLKEAAIRKAPVLLITDDRKEDWFRRQQGLTLGPRIELTEEMGVEAGAVLLLMTTETFLIQAKEHLSAPVSSDTVSQAKELPVTVFEDRIRAEQRELADAKSRRDTLEGRLTHVRIRLEGALARRDRILEDLEQQQHAYDNAPHTQAHSESIIQGLRNKLHSVEKEIDTFKAEERRAQEVMTRLEQLIDMFESSLRAKA